MSDDFMESLDSYLVCDKYRICEDALVYFWNLCFDMEFPNSGLILTSSADSAPFTNVVTQWNGYIESLCPTSGRFVYCTNDDDGDLFNRIVVVDLF